MEGGHFELFICHLSSQVAFGRHRLNVQGLSPSSVTLYGTSFIVPVLQTWQLELKWPPGGLHSSCVDCGALPHVPFLLSKHSGGWDNDQDFMHHLCPATGHLLLLYLGTAEEMAGCLSRQGDLYLATSPPGLWLSLNNNQGSSPLLITSCHSHRM